ncbi:hypothetical protein GGS21DRAFT_486122 [Xylaria nigripes]|nr:hypothetical protein GGS21DRAFT_486122 [Xylaria nigripes]
MVRPLYRNTLLGVPSIALGNFPPALGNENLLLFSFFVPGRNLKEFVEGCTVVKTLPILDFDDIVVAGELLKPLSNRQWLTLQHVKTADSMTRAEFLREGEKRQLRDFVDEEQRWHQKALEEQSYASQTYYTLSEDGS